MIILLDRNPCCDNTDFGACSIFPLLNKIVLKVINMHSPNWRTKALQIASQFNEYVGYQREKEDNKDEVLVVIRDRVHAVKLVRKKVGQAKLLVVEDPKD